MADQAWEKVRATGSLQQGLEAECTELQSQLVKYQQDHNALLIACGLLAGALYSSYTRITSLCTQRHLLEQQVQKLEYFKESVTKTVSDETKSSKSRKNTMKKGLIFRFRIGAIAVLAANRLINMGQHSQRAFVVRDLFNRGDAVSVLAGCINMASGIKNRFSILMP